MTDQTSPAVGTFECPICGYPSPHYHSPSEKIRWHQQYRPIFEASILRRLRRPDQTFYFYGIDAIPINSVARNLGTPGIHARRPGDWAELRHGGGYVCDWLQTLWEIFQDGVCAGLAQHAQQAVESEREKALEEVAQALLDAGYGEAYEVVYKLQSQQPAQADKQANGAAAANASGQEIGWCIERGSASAPQYLHVNGGILEWTLDNMKALRFARRADAEQLAEIAEDASRIAEHVWMGKPTDQGTEQADKDKPCQ